MFLNVDNYILQLERVRQIVVDAKMLNFEGLFCSDDRKFEIQNPGNMYNLFAKFANRRKID